MYSVVLHNYKYLKFLITLMLCIKELSGFHVNYSVQKERQTKRAVIQ
jgi:hypothetical protein